MKRLFEFFVFILYLSATSCQAQKIMRNISDAKKLEINQDKFIGKSLKDLLSQIGPKIKSAIGDPDDTNERQMKHIYLYFIDKKEYLSHYSPTGSVQPLSISVALRPAKVKKLPLSGANPWTEEQVREYGDMIIIRIWVSGKN